MPEYTDRDALKSVEIKWPNILLWFAGEVRNLKAEVAKASRGEAF